MNIGRYVQMYSDDFKSSFTNLTIKKMTQNSIKTYNQTSELRQTNKMIVLKALQSEPNQSRFEIGRKTGLGDIESQRRLSDLVNEDKAIITGSRKHFKHDVSLYSAKQQLTLYQKEKPQKLAEWLKNNHPEILDEYKIYKQSFLF